MKKPIIIAVSLYVALAVIIGLVVPKFKELSVAKSKIEAADNELKYRRDYFSLLGNISDQLNQYQDQLSKIDSAISSEMSALDVFKFIDNVGSQNGLILKEIAVDKVNSSKSIPRLKETHINFVVSGSYPSFKNFLSVLEKSSRIIQIESISFRSSGVSLKGEEIPTFFNVGIKVNSY